MKQSLSSLLFFCASLSLVPLVSWQGVEAAGGSARTASSRPAPANSAFTSAPAPISTFPAPDKSSSELPAASVGKEDETSPLPPSTSQAGSAPISSGSSASASTSLVRPTLKGGVTEDISPFAPDGSMQDVPKGTTVGITLMANVNSELSKVGDEILAAVSLDVRDGQRVLLPGQWFVHGTVSEVSSQRRLGRDGYVTIKFDKLLSPDGKYQIPFQAEASTRDSAIKSVARTVAVDSVYVGKGAVGGALLSVQLTGIPLAIASHGYSVAGGAAIGAGIGAYAALHRKGRIACVLPGEELKFKITKPIVLPQFNVDALPSAAPISKLNNFGIVINRAQFRPDPFGDRASRLLQVDFKMDNQTDKEYSFGNVVVVSDHNQMYYPYALSGNSKNRMKRVAPKSSEQATMTFGVDGPKHKYWLVLLDRGNRGELTRVPVN